MSCVPPRGLSFVGGGDFTATGHEFLGHFTELGGLEPTDRVLDIGCGIGRMAIPLSGYLEGGSYAGFDVGRAMIRWCRRNISTRHQEFEFEWAPIHNAKYNPFGNLSATEYRFPYPDSSFDFAFATSLFTHLVRDEVSHYLAETARVLEARRHLSADLLPADPGVGGRRSNRERRTSGSPTRSRAERRPIPGSPRRRSPSTSRTSRRCSPRPGSTIREPIHPGGWANAPGAPSYQDIIVATRSR